MRIIDLHCYPNTEPWIKSQGPYVEALAKYWNRAWTWKSEAEVVEEFKRAGVAAMLVAFAILAILGSRAPLHGHSSRSNPKSLAAVSIAIATVFAWPAMSPPNSVRNQD